MPRKSSAATIVGTPIPLPDPQWALDYPLGEGQTFTNQNVNIELSAHHRERWRSGHGAAPVWNGSLTLSEDRRYDIGDLARFAGGGSPSRIIQAALDGLMDSRPEEIKGLLRRGGLEC